MAASASGEADGLREQLQRLRCERDALAERVLQLEQQVVPASLPTSAPELGFEDAFRIEQSRAKRHGLPLSVALVELDGVQDLRDRFGHAAGEDTLAHLGGVLGRSLRPTDVVARVDGLAWGVLLTATGLEQALVALCRVQHDAAAIPLGPGPTGEPLIFSAGLVQWRTDEALGDLMSRASRALGLARRAGGGRTVLG